MDEWLRVAFDTVAGRRVEQPAGDAGIPADR